ncbi:MAG: ATP-dependent helicase HrpB [Hyphomicrobiaceae bacterium]|jgi:ATP-dependent helicase HrpB
MSSRRDNRLAPLPIDEVLDQLIDALVDRGVAVLRAPTGAGKTTRVAPALLDRILADRTPADHTPADGTAKSGSRAKTDAPDKIILLEPRRMAARAAAARIAAERGGKLGDEIGYEVRFDRRVSSRTRLVVMTEGILLRRLQADPFLEDTAAILFDEFHERSLDADLGLAMAAKVRREARPDLKLCAMSATLDPGPVAAFLDNAPIIESKGRSFPVDVQWRPAQERAPLEPAIASAVGEALDSSPGDILVFLAGVGEIRRARRAVEASLASAGIQTVELYGDLSPDKQDAALRRGAKRRVILATNVAETSVTIQGVTAVVDTGLAKVMRYDPALGMDRLVRVRVARSSADQRTGRAGRTAPGICLRLWSRQEDLSLRAREEPELRRTDIARALLELRAWGERDATQFPWLEAPEPIAIERAEHTLTMLGAIDERGITPIGRMLVAIPAPVRIARMLIETHRFGHAQIGAAAAAMLSERDPSRGRDHQARSSSAWESDVLAALDRVRAGEAGGRNFEQARSQLLRVVEEFGDAGAFARKLDTGHKANAEADASGASRAGRIAPDEAVLRAVLAAWPDRVARRREPKSVRGVLCGGRGVVLDESSEVHEAELFVCVTLDAGRRGTHAEALVRTASTVERAWLDPARINSIENVRFDAATGRVTATQQTLYDDLVLEEKPVKPSTAALEAALAEAAATDLGRALDLENTHVVGLRQRLAFLATSMPELELPLINDDTIRSILPELCRGRRSFDELRKAKIGDTLAATIGWKTVELLNRHAPTHATIPSGRRVQLVYRDDAPPILAAKIQELFGLAEAPRIADGRARVVVHLLAPNGRPAQVTDDLGSFWRSGYTEVRKELRRRYPKHAWPEDPTNAPPSKPRR